MPIYLDFVGLNTLVNEPLSSSTNNIGYPLSTTTNNYLNTSLASIGTSSYLAGLNLHRNGPYGYSTFKQLRISDNPLTRDQRKNNIFSYVLDGSTVKQKIEGSSVVSTFIEKRGVIRNITESIVTSNFHPIVVVGATSDDNQTSGQKETENIELVTSFGNEIYYFSDDQANREYNLNYKTDSGYEELTDLYLNGALDSDSSPLDQFGLLRYSHTIYPKAGNAYLNEVRGRPYYVSGYWRNARSDRNELYVDNGFGFEIPSQSIWYMDAEDDFLTRFMAATKGHFSASVPQSASFDTFSATPATLNFADNDIRIVAGDPEGVPAGDNSTIQATVANDGTYEVLINAEKYSLNSIDGVSRYWDAWHSALGFAGTANTSVAKSYVSRSSWTAVDGHFDNQKYFLRIDSSAFNDLAYREEFDHMLFHFWGKDIASGKGYVFREVDSEKNTRKSLYLNQTRYELEHAIVFDKLDRDRSKTYHTSSNTSNGSVGLYWYYQLESAYGREWNNYVFDINTTTQPPAYSHISAYLNGVEKQSSNFLLIDTYGALSNGEPLVEGHTHGYEIRNGYEYMLQHDAISGTEIDFTGGNAVFNFALKLKSTAQTDFDTSDAAYYQTIFYASSGYVGGGGNNRRGIWIYLHKDGSTVKLYIMINIDGTSHVRLSYNISDYVSTSQFQDFSIKISAGSPTTIPNSVRAHSSIVKVKPIGDTTETTIPAINESWGASKDSSHSLGGKDLFTHVFKTWSLFGINGENTDTIAQNYLGMKYYRDASTFFRGYLHDFALDQFLIGNGASGNTVNDNYILNYTGSAYGSTGDIVVWYQLGDHDDPDYGNNLSLLEKVVFDSKTSAGSNGSSYNLTGAGPSFTNSFNLVKITGLSDTFYSPTSWHTSSIMDVFLLCKTSSAYSTGNSSTDYFQGGEIADIALFNSTASATELANSPTYTFLNPNKTSLTQTASIWWANSGSDSITANGANISCRALNSDYAAYKLTGSYAGATKLHERGEGLVMSGSARFIYFASSIAQSTNVSTVGSGLEGLLASSLLGEVSNLYVGGATGYNSNGSPGVLLNSYNQFNSLTASSTTPIDHQFSASCVYSRRHTLRASGSFYNPQGKNHKGQVALRDLDRFELYQGNAAYEAGGQAGKNPFYDSYASYGENFRLVAKDYSVIPEFKISNHIDKYLTQGDTDFSLTDTALFEVTGGDINKNNSNLDGFYELYSMSDFLKNFEIVQSDHEDFANPIEITIKCKAYKQFLPYEGFYPADRTVKMAKQFYSSYADNLKFSSTFVADENPKYAAQYLLNPLFAPGVLFNTIKSGIACDYPIITGSFDVERVNLSDALNDDETTGSYYIKQLFDTRIPFEAIVEPEKYLANKPLASNEPDPNGRTDSNVIWTGQGDEKYKLMASNFLAETADFFLENKNFTTITSLPQGDPNFGNAVAGRKYTMRMRMFRSITGSKDTFSTNGMSYAIPQDTGSMTESFTMYTRPSAFGPPVLFSGSIKPTTWSKFKPDGSDDFSYVLNASYTTTSSMSNLGFNFPFTPPYYHGEAWADFTFTANETKKYTLNEIINSSSVEFYRFWDTEDESTAEFCINGSIGVNDQAMQLASSFNLFSKGIVEDDLRRRANPSIGNNTSVRVDTDIGNSYRWIIQSKYETPMLNFNHITGSHLDPATEGLERANLAQFPNIAPETMPIGMWHHYGKIPTDPKEGVFVEITDIPEGWVVGAMNRIAETSGSLVELCGFANQPVRVGELKRSKKVSEAIVAIPFLETSGEREFFKIQNEDIENALDPSKINLVGKSIKDMVSKMKKYVFPPSFDFVANRDIEPFAMYIFEFSHTFTKQDLADMWQNLQPDIGLNFEEVESSITHRLLAHELMGSGAVTIPGRDTELQLKREEEFTINSNVRWMVFKVKQRAKTKYFEKIFERNDSSTAGESSQDLTVKSTGIDSRATYNWPYDYFSLVELVKIDTDVVLANLEKTTEEKEREIKTLKKSRIDDTRPPNRVGRKKYRKKNLRGKK